jgi:hypothetical protein
MKKYALLEPIMDRGTLHAKGSLVELTDEQVAALGPSIVLEIPLANVTAPLSPAPSADDAPVPPIEPSTAADPSASQPAANETIPSEETGGEPDVAPETQPSKPSSKSEKKQS